MESPRRRAVSATVVPSCASSRFLGTGADAGRAHALALRLLAGTVNREAQVQAFNHVFQGVAELVVVVLPLVLLLRAQQASAPVEVAVE